ncbi:MAG TPA: SRPBCC domain-containing protein [Thermoplasmata archaeon]|nr:SRPBCC domain-containing protein [Thermoplasmata archaeon]
MFDDLDPILIQVTIPLPPSMIFSAFTDAAQVESWLGARAVIEPKLGGRYELTFSGETPFVSRGRVTHFSADLDVGFSWQGPPPFESLMNGDSTTQVYVRLQESPEGIDVTLEHTGWKSGEQWEAARSWHFHLWDEALHRLKDYALKAAYG